MAIKQDCQRLFQTDDLYNVLNLEKSDGLTKGQVKQAYYTAALQYHPDKAPPMVGDKSEATEKFQLLSKVYSILVDKEKRHVYDSLGEVPHNLVFESNFDWYSFWETETQYAKDIESGDDAKSTPTEGVLSSIPTDETPTSGSSASELGDSDLDDDVAIDLNLTSSQEMKLPANRVFANRDQKQKKKLTIMDRTHLFDSSAKAQSVGRGRVATVVSSEEDVAGSSEAVVPRKIRRCEGDSGVRVNAEKTAAIWLPKGSPSSWSKEEMLNTIQELHGRYSSVLDECAKLNREMKRLKKLQRQKNPMASDSDSEENVGNTSKSGNTGNQLGGAEPIGNQLGGAELNEDYIDEDTYAQLIDDNF